MIKLRNQMLRVKPYPILNYFISVKSFLFLLGMLISTTVFATDYYMTPNGAGSKSGSNFSNALAWSDYSATQLDTFINSTMSAGDSLFLGSGSYSGKRINIDSSGTSGNPKKIIGTDTGGGQPLMTYQSWTRTNPDSGNFSLLQFSVAGNSYWEISGLDLKGAQYAIRFPDTTTPHTNIVLRDINVSDVRHGLYAWNLDDSTLENVSVTHYTKHAFRLQNRCNSVEFIRCLADLANGDTSWWDYSEGFPFGFNLIGEASKKNTDTTLTDCVAMNNRQNGQASNGYWNGDGFVVENESTGTTFIRCHSFDNDDAGFDIKPSSTLDGCVAFGNKRNFRNWNGSHTLTNCIAGYPSKRGGNSSEDNFWLSSANVIYDFCTAHSNKGAGVREAASGSATVTNSIISFTGASGAFTAGNVSVDTSTDEYRPGSGTNPNYVNDDPDWDGIGTDFDSVTHGASKGYYSGGSSGGTPIDIIVDNNDAGASSVGTWSASTTKSGYYGSDYQHDGNTSKGSKSFTFTPNLTAETYEVFLRWTADTNRANNVPVDIIHAGGTTTVTVNQTANGGQWNSLGIYTFNGGSSEGVKIRTTGTTNYVIADAARFISDGSSATPTEETLDNNDSEVTKNGSWSASTSAGGYIGSDYLHDGNTAKGSKSVDYEPQLVPGSYEIFIRYTSGTNRASNVPVDIVHSGGTSTVIVNQKYNGGTWRSLGSYNLGASPRVTIRTTGTNGYVIADAVRFTP